ncbi:MAG: SRPBCC domain-containing protein [Myxococcota bacterium]
MPDAAQQTRTTFRLEVSIATNIAAPPERVWALLTDGAGFATWNSTVTSIEGTIAKGEKIVIRVPYSERAFPATVLELEEGAAARRMVWGDGFAPMFRGDRTYEVTTTEGGCRFSMVEVFRGAMLPMIAKSFPDFGPIFETYARDLKAAAEG